MKATEERVVERDGQAACANCGRSLNVSDLHEALRIAEENGPNCPLSSDACGEYFVQIRNLLRKVVGTTEGS